MNRISEDEADNRHFVSQLEKGRNISYPDRRDLHVSFLVHNIHEVDVPRQRFHALFNVYVSWVEEKVNINPDADPSSDVWSKDMFEKCFDPELRITNCMEWNPDEDEIWYRVVTVDKTQKVKCNQYRHMSVSEFKSKIKDNNNVEVSVIRAQRFQGWFEEDFEMKDFPLEVQHLHLGVMSRWDETHAAISFDRYQPSTVSSQALSSQEWTMSDPRLFSYRDDWDENSLRLLTEKADSASGVRYCKAYFAITLSRKAGNVLWNIMFIMTLVGCFSFATFALPPSDLGSRLSVVLTLVLTTVAFKYVTMNMMPAISYVTMMDVVIYGCMLLQAFMLLSICISKSFFQDNSQKQKDFDKVAALALASAWGCLLIWFTTRFFWLRRTRNKYIDKCNAVYGDAYSRDESNLYTIEDTKAKPPHHSKTRYTQAKRKVNHRGNLHRTSTIRKRNASNDGDLSVAV